MKWEQGPQERSTIFHVFMIRIYPPPPQSKIKPRYRNCQFNPTPFIITVIYSVYHLHIAPSLILLGRRSSGGRRKMKMKKKIYLEAAVAMATGRHAEAVSKQRSFHPSLSVPLSSTSVYPSLGNIPRRSVA